MDLSLASLLVEGLSIATPRILWRNLTGSKVAEFKYMLEGCFRLVDDVDQMWTTLANSIKSAGKRV